MFFRFNTNVYGCHLLEDGSDGTGGVEVMNVEWVYLRALESQRLKQGDDKWGTLCSTGHTDVPGACGVVSGPAAPGSFCVHLGLNATVD